VPPPVQKAPPSRKPPPPDGGTECSTKRSTANETTSRAAAPQHQEKRGRLDRLGAAFASSGPLPPAPARARRYPSLVSDLAYAADVAAHRIGAALSAAIARARACLPDAPFVPNDTPRPLSDDDVDQLAACVDHLQRYPASSAATIFGRARTMASSSDSAIPTGTMTRSRSLPFTGPVPRARSQAAAASSTAGRPAHGSMTALTSGIRQPCQISSVMCAPRAPA